MTHASSRISALRSVAFDVPDLALAETFFTQTWHLTVAHRQADALYLRATGADHHVLALHRADGPAAIRCVTLRARSRSALDEVAQATGAAGGQVVAPPAADTGPAGGTSLKVRDADGRIFEVVYGDRLHDDVTEDQDRPLRLAHVVLNSHRVEHTRQFVEQVLGFSLSDRTRIMAFMRCNNDHHSIALGDTDNDALNHVAFLMPDLDGVMRGAGRMKDAGYAIEWGPGRHGPGDNAFNYFVGPFNLVIEYTAEVEQVDDSYQAGQPGDWKWPPGRVDQWGIGVGPTERLKQAQKAVCFVGAVRP
jgi:catechol 2,3-dioxygenase-like lactoylglutathione lyase family enzyme